MGNGNNGNNEKMDVDESSGEKCSELSENLKVPDTLHIVDDPLNEEDCRTDRGDEVLSGEQESAPDRGLKPFLIS